MDRFETYSQTLDFLYAQLPMFSRVGERAMKKDLDNILALSRFLDHPEHHFPSLHVAGTNGKGSVSHMMASVLRQAGYRTGLYTSPHLKDFRERMRIDGEMISEQEVLDLVNRLLPEILRIQPSFFEVTVAMAFQWFFERKVDVAVIEVGLGGRLDSTNIIVPELSIITNISYDHQHILGNTLSAIAGEKAGIIKAAIPVVIGESHPETEPVFRSTAQRLQAPMVFADRCWDIREHCETSDYQAWSLHGPMDPMLGPGSDLEISCDLKGSYQNKNILTALTALYWLRQQGWNLPEAAIKQGLRQVRALSGLAGRWDIIGHKPLTILDVAHNEAGIRQVVQQFTQTVDPPYRIVVGFVKDKDIRSMLNLFPKDARYYFCQAHIPRALPAEALQSMAAAAGLQGTAYEDVNAAVEAARKQAGPDGQVLVCGSCFVIGEVRSGADPAL